MSLRYSTKCQIRQPRFTGYRTLTCSASGSSVSMSAFFPLLAEYSWAAPLNTDFHAYKTIEPSEFDPLNKSPKSCSTSSYAAFRTP